MVTTKDLREMCLNGVTLDDIRRLYGVNATFEDIEPVLPSHLIGDLGMFPCREVATKISESQVRGQQAQKQEVNPIQDTDEENKREENFITNHDIEEEAKPRQDKMEKANSIEVEKGDAPPQPCSAYQQVARETEPEVPSPYNQLPPTVFWQTLLALCLLAPNANLLDILTSLEILSHLDEST